MSYDFDCYCDTNDGDLCAMCETVANGRLRMLGRNLAAAGQLQRMFRLGQRYQYAQYSQEKGHAYDMRANWLPNADGKAAP